MSAPKVGRTFTGVSKSGRVIPLGQVRSHTPLCSPFEWLVCWFDENGKHYERFDLSNPGREFREFNWVS